MKPMSVEIAKSVLGMTKEEADKFIVHNTTAKAYEHLINKKADLIFVSEPSDSILKDAKNAGVEFEMVGIGRDGFVKRTKFRKSKLNGKNGNEEFKTS